VLDEDGYNDPNHLLECIENMHHQEKYVRFYRTFGEMDNTQKVSKTMNGPQISLGTEQRLARGRKAKKR